MTHASDQPDGGIVRVGPFADQFDERAVLALYSNTAAKKDLPTFEASMDGLLGRFLATEIDGLKRECRRRAADELEEVINNAAEVT